MKIGIASDHNGYELKGKIIDKLQDKFEIIDYGNTEHDMDDDFPIYSFRLSKHVAKHDVDFGIVICGTGIGTSIACNKVNGIRCAKVNNIKEVILAKKHNNANILAVGMNLTAHEISEYIETFINTEFSDNPRYQRRNDIITLFENGKYDEL